MRGCVVVAGEFGKLGLTGETLYGCYIDAILMRESVIRQVTGKLKFGCELCENLRGWGCMIW